MKVYIAFHTFGEGHEIKVFESKKSRAAWCKALLKEYQEEYKSPTELQHNDLPDLDGQLNLELSEQETVP